MLDPTCLDAIKQFEGYNAAARWDYAQNTNGYGTRARYAGEVIDKAEAEKRFADEIKKAADFVEKFAPDLDSGSKAALASLTYNAGTAWTESGLGQAIASGDLDKARSLFLQYNKAGGSVLEGLVQRRLQEVAWFGDGQTGTNAVTTEGAAATLQTAEAGTPVTLASIGSFDLAPATALGSLPASGVSPASTASSSLAGFNPSTRSAFANLGDDATVLALLSYLAKSHVQPSSDAQPRNTANPVTSA